ncbi:MAG: hypothetical protein JNK58_10135 [Phycisphaerae bacterium]|nr:hypothetical protein [Phycisphaerae bacterium]
MTDTPAATPPVNPGDPSMFDLPEPQTWPKPVGITSLSIAGLNLTCFACAGVGLGMQLIFSEQMAEQFPDGMPPSMTGVSIPMVASLSMSAILQGLLIAAGATLLMRRAIARPLHLTYAVLGLIVFVIGTIIQVQMQVEMTEWVKANSTTKFAQQQQATGWIGEVIGWTIGILFGFGWPAFCAVWFGLIKRKSTDITEGVEAVI